LGGGGSVFSNKSIPGFSPILTNVENLVGVVWCGSQKLLSGWGSLDRHGVSLVLIPSFCIPDGYDFLDPFDDFLFATNDGTIWRLKMKRISRILL
jgi:hypothetical protein